VVPAERFDSDPSLLFPSLRVHADLVTTHHGVPVARPLGGLGVEGAMKANLQTHGGCACARRGDFGTEICGFVARRRLTRP